MNTGHGGADTAGRDLRLDFFRGLALFCIFIDHIPNNILSRFTLQSFGMSDAAEVFILISGYAAGMVYGRVLDRQGVVLSTARIYHRVWQLYVAHIFLFVLFLATVAHTVAMLNSAIYAEEFRAADFLRQPDVAVIKALTLQFQPTFMDILPLYIVLLGVLPAVLLGLRRWPAAVLGASAALWLAVQLDKGIALPAYPGPNQTWFFNPFAWQALFYFGAWLGWRRGALPALFESRWLFRGAVVVVVVLFAIKTSWTLHWVYDPFPALFARELWPRLSKTDLSILRLIDVLALALLVARLIAPQAAVLASRWARPFVLCGQHSLHVFCLGILLSVIGHLVINQFFGGIPLQIAVSAAGVAIMVGVAALMDWFSAARPAARAPAGGGRAGAEGGR